MRYRSAKDIFLIPLEQNKSPHMKYIGSVPASKNTKKASRIFMLFGGICMICITWLCLTSKFRYLVRDGSAQLSVQDAAARPALGASIVGSATQISSMEKECSEDIRTALQGQQDADIQYASPIAGNSKEVYSTIIGVAGIIGGAQPRHQSEFDLLTEKISKVFEDITVEWIYLSSAYKVTINGGSYILKNMSLNRRRTPWSPKDLSVRGFDSPYIIKVLLAFRKDGTEWIVMEYVNSEMCTADGDSRCTKEEIWLLVHDVLHGLKHIHEQGYFHGDMRKRNIIGIKDYAGKTLGYKIIDLGITFKNGCGKLPQDILQADLVAIKAAIKEYLRNKCAIVERSPQGTYHVASYGHNGGSKLKFLEEDRVLVDFLFTCRGDVEHPPKEIADLLQHPYVTGKKWTEDMFGKRLYRVETANLTDVGISTPSC